MQVLILSGGFGTRLRPLTLYRPKQLLPLGDKTIIEHLLHSLKDAGFGDMTLAVNSAHAEAFKKALVSYKLRWIIEAPQTEDEKLGAVGAIWNAKKSLGGEPLIIVGADNFAPGIDFKKIAAQHAKSGSLATIVLYKLPDKDEVSKYGVVVVDGKRIVGFQEKPSVAEAKSSLISTALYIIQPEFFKHLETYLAQKRARGEKPDNLGDLWAWMVQQGFPVGYSVLGSYWSDIGSIKGYLDATIALLKLKGVPVMKGRGCTIGRSRIGPNVVLGDGCRIGDGCAITDSILFREVAVGDNCTITGSIIDDKAAIGPGKTLKDQVVEKGSFIN